MALTGIWGGGSGWGVGRGRETRSPRQFRQLSPQYFLRERQVDGVVVAREAGSAARPLAQRILIAMNVTSSCASEPPVCFMSRSSTADLISGGLRSPVSSRMASRGSSPKRRPWWPADLRRDARLASGQGGARCRHPRAAHVSVAPTCPQPIAGSRWPGPGQPVGCHGWRRPASCLHGSANLPLRACAPQCVPALQSRGYMFIAPAIFADFPLR
jgi:hypothetical protein